MATSWMEERDGVESTPCEGKFFRVCGRTPATHCDCGCDLYLCDDCNADWLAAKRERDVAKLVDEQIAAEKAVKENPHVS